MCVCGVAGESWQSGNDRDQAKPTWEPEGVEGRKVTVMPKHQGQEEGRAHLPHSALGSPSTNVRVQSTEQGPWCWL